MRPTPLIRDAYLLAGPTASGKSAAACVLARRRGAVILNADSMLVYRGMNVGTAKSSPEEIQEFQMGGINLVSPAEHFSSGAWLRAAAAWLKTIPPTRPIIIVGGTGLYFSALLRGLDRAWNKPPPDYPVLHVPRATLHARIAMRLSDMFLSGLAEEVKALRAQYPVWSNTASAAIGYKEFLSGLSLEEIKQKILIRTRQLAKRQETWFRHQASPIWIPIGETTEETVSRVEAVWHAHGPWRVQFETKETLT